MRVNQRRATASKSELLENIMITHEAGSDLILHFTIKEI